MNFREERRGSLAMLLSASSSSLLPNETRSFALAEGHWSGQEKRTGETTLCGVSEARGV